MADVSHLKPGDEVVYQNRSGRWLRKVVRVTRTGRIVIKLGTGEATFRPTGWEIGRDSWDAANIVPATPELRAEVAEERERSSLVNYIRATELLKMPLPALREAAAALKRGGQ